MLPQEVDAVDDPLIIANKKFPSRLMIGTGKYSSNTAMVQSIKSSEANIVTVAIRRLPLDKPSEKNILDFIDWNQYTLLPNTAGSTTVEEAVFTARLAKQATGTNWVKLEVIPDPYHLFPDPVGTLHAAETLVKDGFIVLPYIHADPILARQLEEVGCATVMPLGSAIGSGQGIRTLEEIKLIIDRANIPVVVDAGLAVPSDASLALEIGASAVLVNTAIARSKTPVLMAKAFRDGVLAGRSAFLAGRIPAIEHGRPSSPTEAIPQAPKNGD